MRRLVLIVKCGSAQRPVAARFGDYETWFIRALGGDPSHFTVVNPQKGEPFPDPARCAAVIATASTASVLERRPWMTDTGSFLLKAAEQGVPVLGVGFGHQLLADALGGQVQKSPKGREFGTVDVTLTADGERHPLFRGLIGTVTFQTSHEDEVVALPPGATLLAGNAHTPIQAFQSGGLLFGVQFAPELWLEPIKALADERRLTAQHFRATEAPAGRTLLHNFESHYIAPRAD